MKYRPLGTTGLTVSEIGYGTWGIGGVTPGATSYGKTDDNVSREALRYAFDNGVTFYDTADIYGAGHSEELLGEVFGGASGIRDKVILASKVGFLGHNQPQDFSPLYMRQTLEGILTRLNTDYLDLYQLHSPPIGMVTAEAIAALETFKEEGLIRAYGISLQKTEDGFAAIELGFRSIQANYNMIDQRIRDNGLLDKAHAEGASIIARTPLGFGFLTGRITSTNFTQDDHRSAWPKEQLERWNRAPKLFGVLNETPGPAANGPGTGETPRTMTQLALQFCIAHPAVATVIPGMLSPAEVEENVSASALPPLTSDELAEIKKIYEENEFYDRGVQRSNLPKNR